MIIVLLLFKHHATGVARFHPFPPNPRSSSMPRPPVLTDVKRAEVLALVSCGVSRRQAALYVGCAPATVSNTADRDPEFHEALHNAEAAFVRRNLIAIERGAEKSWRAGAWLLERCRPAEYAKRRPNTLTHDEAVQQFRTWIDAVMATLP